MTTFMHRCTVKSKGNNKKCGKQLLKGAVQLFEKYEFSSNQLMFDEKNNVVMSVQTMSDVRYG